MKNEKLSELHYHEALDRSALLLKIIDATIMNHPVVERHPRIMRKLLRAQDLMGQVYQDIANIK